MQELYMRGLHGSTDSAIYIFLTSNFITEFTNDIEWQFNCSHPSYAKVDITRNYIMHITDILHGWNVGIFHWYCIMQLGFDSTLHFRALAFKVDYAWSYDFRYYIKVNLQYILRRFVLSRRRDFLHAARKCDQQTHPTDTATDRNTNHATPSVEIGRVYVMHSGSVAEWLACWTQAQKGPG